MSFYLSHITDVNIFSLKRVRKYSKSSVAVNQPFSFDDCIENKTNNNKTGFFGEIKNKQTLNQLLTAAVVIPV